MSSDVRSPLCVIRRRAIAFATLIPCFLVTKNSCKQCLSIMDYARKKYLNGVKLNPPPPLEILRRCVKP